VESTERIVDSPTPKQEAKPWVKRLLAAQGISLTEKEVFWWNVYLERFLAFCRRQGESNDVATSGRAFLDHLRQLVRP
jgi:hypothetical protein